MVIAPDLLKFVANIRSWSIVVNAWCGLLSSQVPLKVQYFTCFKASQGKVHGPTIQDHRGHQAAGTARVGYRERIARRRASFVFKKEYMVAGASHLAFLSN